MHIDHDFQQIEKDLDGLLGPGRHRRLPWKASEIRRLRLLAGLTQAQLSELTGIMQPKISEAERGLASSKGRKEKKESGAAPRMETRLLYALAKVLGCELRDIAEVPDFAKPVTGISSDVIRQLQSQLLTVDQIHTLVRPGEKTSLRAIYYRTALIDRAGGGANRSPTNSAFQADTLHDIPTKASVMLGTAGQGKSMFLRHLAVQETLKEQSLAIFLELRRWPSLPLADVIHKKLKNWQLCETQQQMHDLLAGGHVSLLFDAVDELDPDRRGQFLAELADLHASHPTLKIVVTSRPDSGILTCDWLHPYAIAPLALPDVRALVRIYATPAEAEQIMVQLDQLNRNLRELLTTPIFVALLIIKFRYSQTLPTDMTAFYRDLFDALVRRHNMAESGLRRKLKSGLLPFDLETVFQQICLAIHQQFGDQSPHLRQVQDIADQIVHAGNLSVESASLVVSDIIHITNLLLEEAGYCFFIHKSVREYYAADCIAKQ
ncbi:NACHT domain-containing protein [bacterium]|nr:NACHT domain-containing protein [bacterium]